MHSAVVTITMRRRDSDGSRGPLLPVKEVPWVYEGTVYARARLPVVVDALHLALVQRDMLGDDDFSHCTVSFKMGAAKWGQVCLMAQESQIDGEGLDDEALIAAIRAWVLEQHEAALAHPTVARMLRVL